ALYVDKETNPAQRSSAQGLFMMMTNGFGATIGTLTAQVIVNRFVFTPQATGASPIQVWEGWQLSWYIFAGFALLVAILFWLFFPKTPVKE
ncbi:MAG: MFS transporter, partial [Paludibacteraceae bacterium]|nr:MFS transporter [Paludibacteraceae bacterium]